ncbi:MAG: hypothetical protein OXG62_01685 [Nitrospinae bacterium]|nr:hypothetical protein [Nitrospinota bacterium]
MSVTTPETYFRKLGEFPHRDLFEEGCKAWEAVGRLEDFVRNLVDEADAPLGEAAALRVEEGLVVSEGLLVSKESLKIASVGLLIEAGVRVEPGVVIKGPTVLCSDAEVRHGAYLRGGCLIGPDAIVGHATEVKNSAFLNGAHAGHFAYVGDSILGADSNLGAGVKLANLELRTEEEKKTGVVKNIVLRAEGEWIDTGLTKFGAVIGDDVEIGCNAVTSPGVLLGPGSWIAPSVTVSKGVYPERTLIRGPKPNVGHRPF